MTKIFNPKRDGFNSRLLLYVKRRTGIDFEKVSDIKKGVWIATSAKESWIIKEFPNPVKLKHQILLTKLLSEYGFNNTYQFHRVHETGPCYFEGRFLGIVQYIEPSSKKPFYYNSAGNRKDALDLLCRYHSISLKCIPKLKDKLATFNLLEKWEKRLESFKKNFDFIKGLSMYPYLEKYTLLGEGALQIMQAHESYFSVEPHCVLHGDLAHHNFIRKVDGSLYMIDFDLASIGPKQIDILQYCNRILPEVGW